MNLILTLAQTDGGILELARNTGEQFGFNGWMFLSQVLSFIIVCTLLQQFAYKPILQVLEERRTRIREGLENADKIKQQLADAELRYQEILSNANAAAQKMIDEARASSATLSERRTQQAIGEAEQIIKKAREATALEHDRMLTELKREVGRLVVETTSKVTGKVLTPEDHNRISAETASQVAA
jgi:F-type H+-transporting ATPase subunit b